MKPRKTLTDMAKGTAQQELQIAGKPATACPYCGCGMFVDGVNRTDREIVRYVQCRNQKCGRRFMSVQQPAKLIREIEDNSAGGSCELTLLRDSA